MSRATRHSTAWAAASSSMASTAWTLRSTVRSLRAAMVAMALWSSELAEVGMESTEAGWVRTLFSETMPAAQY